VQRIEEAGLFIIPLDGERYWYRYHHLFAEFLRNRLLLEYGEEVSALHLRASEWFEGNGFLEEAIDHAIAAGDYERAVSLLQNIAVALLRRRELTTLYRWLRQLPEPIIQRPTVLIFLAWT
jgi:LuxR family transcriptional regulator, maltose regulon positive regulatory protein